MLGSYSTRPLEWIDRGQPGGIDPEVPDKLPAAVGVGRGEFEGDAVAGQEVPQLVTARRPVIPDDPVDDVARAVRQRPGGQRLLHLGIEPLLRSDPSLHHDLSISPSAVARWRVASSVNGMRVPCRSIVTSSTRLVSRCS